MKEVTDLFYLSAIDADPESVLPELVSVVGQKAALEIIEIFGGMKIRIPTREEMAKSVRNACVWRDHLAGMAVNDIEEKYGISAQAVLGAIKKWSSLQRAQKVGNCV